MSLPAENPTNVRYGVLTFACVLSMITYMDRVCFGTVAPFVQAEFGLEPADMSWIFGAFTFAYAVFEVPTGWLGDAFGPRKTLIRIVIWWSFFTAVTGSIYPTFIFAFPAMLAVRFLFGVGEAGAYPNIARAFHNWFPYNERGFAKGTVWMAGRFAGGITPFIVLALLYETPTENAEGGPGVLTHWRHVFWIFGAIGVVWCVWFWFWFTDRPEQNPSVNPAELALIKSGFVGTPTGDPSTTALRAGEPPIRPTTVAEPAKPLAGVPWLKLFTSVNLWLICFMYFCASYGWYFNITYLPGFLRTQFHMEPGDKWSAPWWQYSLMAGMPLLVGSLACIVGGYFTDLFIKRTGNRKWGRRLFGMVGHGLCATFYFISMTVMGYDSPWPFVLCIAFATFWNDITMGAAWASCIDIGGRYSGIVSGCMNTIGNLGGFTANILTGYVLQYYTQGIDRVDNPDGYKVAIDYAWVINFLIFSAVYVLAVILWMGFDASKPIDASDDGKNH
jgi:ACS family glucarate transporter-like MFS transporter